MPVCITLNMHPYHTHTCNCAWYGSYVWRVGRTACNGIPLSMHLMTLTLIKSHDVAAMCGAEGGWRTTAHPCNSTKTRSVHMFALNFMLVCGSYVWRGGRLARVPAARADIFRDRSLEPADKRALMRFLTAAADALRGTGPLQVRHLLLSGFPSSRGAVCHAPSALGPYA